MNKVYFIEEYKAGETPTVDLGAWINEHMLSRDPHLQLDIHATAVTHAQFTRVYCWYMSCDTDKDLVYMHQFFDVPEGDDADDAYWGREIRPQKTFKHNTPYEFAPVTTWDVEHSYVPDPSSEDNSLDEPYGEPIEFIWDEAKKLQGGRTALNKPNDDQTGL